MRLVPVAVFSYDSISFSSMPRYSSSSSRMGLSSAAVSRFDRRDVTILEKAARSVAPSLRGHKSLLAQNERHLAASGFDRVSGQFLAKSLRTS